MAERGLLAAGSSWADVTTVTSLYPSTISTDGNATLRAAFEGPGCSADASSLYLTFVSASPSGQDVVVSGQADTGCGSATFQVAKSSAFRSIRAGSYSVRMSAGRNRLPLSFVSEGSANASAANATKTSETQTLVTIVDAAVGRFLGQAVSASSSNLTITLSVGLDGPSPLPTTMGLRLSDPTAADVTPASVTWRPGEMAAKQFRLLIRRPASLRSNASSGSNTSSLWAEALPVSNLQFANGTAPRWDIQVPVPGFYVVLNHAVYRSSGNASSSSNGTGGGSGGSGGGGGRANSSVSPGAAVESVAVAVRRVGPSPFPSTVNYTVVLLQALGCPAGTSCAAAVRGVGSLRFLPEKDVAAAAVLVNWTALLPAATLRLGLRLTPGDNADILAAPANATALFVYGTTYGVCPAGTLGPWREPSPALAADDGTAQAVALSALGNVSSSTVPPAASSSPVLNSTTCNEAMLLSKLAAYVPTAALLPVLAACSGEGVDLAVPCNASMTANATAAPPAPAARQPPLPPAPGAQVDQLQSVQQAELHVPFSRDAAAVLLPLGSAAETVIVLHSTCSPSPAWQTVVLPAPAASANASAASNASKSTGVPGVAAPPPLSPVAAPAVFARWLLPEDVDSCYATVGVYTAVTQPRAPGSNAVTQSAAFGSVPPPSPAPSPGPSSVGRGLLASAAAPPPSPPSPTNLTPSPNRSPSPAPAPAPAPAPRAIQGDDGMSVVSLVQLRTYNITLRPLSDPAVFAALALVLRSTTSGRYLPLCGVPQQLLRAAAASAQASLPGQAGLNATGVNATQLAVAAALLAQAIRGNPAAVVKLAPPGAGAPPSGQSAGRRHKLLEALALPQRWLAALQAGAKRNVARTGVAVGWQGRTGGDGAVDASRVGGVEGTLRFLLGRTSRRRLLQGPGSPGVAPRAPSSAPADAPEGADDANPPADDDAPSAPQLPPTPPRSSPVPGLAPLPASNASAPSPVPPPPAIPGAGPAAPEAVAASAPDGFDMPDGAGGLVRVLFNRQYMDWCGPGEAQVVDLALLAAAGEDMALEASSGGAVLQQAGGWAVVVGDAVRMALLEQRQAAAAAAEAAKAAEAQAAAASKQGDESVQLGLGGGGDGSGTSSKSVLGTRLPEDVIEQKSASLMGAESAGGAEANRTSGSNSTAAGGSGATEPASLTPPAPAASPVPSPAGAGALSPRSPVPPAHAPVSPPPGPVASNTTAAGAEREASGTGDGDACLDDAARLAADRRLPVSWLAPDGVTAATVLLDLYLDYSQAVATAIAAAAQCISESRNRSSAADATGAADTALGAAPPGGNGTTRAPSAGPLPPPRSAPPPSPPVPMLTLPLTAAAGTPVVSLLDACRLCGPGSYSVASNVSACAPCSPGTFSGDPYNTGCAQCPAGSFAVQWGSVACRLCPAGSFAPRNGSTACSVCPAGTTTMADGEAACVAAPPPPSAGGGSQFALLVSFQVLLDVSQRGDTSSLAANTTGIDAPPDSIVRLLVAADTAEALRIPPTQVRVTLQEVSPSAFLVNVSATLPIAAQTTSASSIPGSSGASAPGAAPDSSPSRDVDADTLINRLVSDPGGSFPRTKEATGGSLQVQYVERQVVPLEARGGGLSPHVVVWPTLGGTAALAALLGLAACGRCCRRRRGRQPAASLPPLSDAFGRLWGGPISAPPVYLMYGHMPALELQELPQPPTSAPRHRRGGSKSGLAGAGMSLGLGLGLGSGAGAGSQGVLPHSASASGTNLDALAAMYTRDALAGPRI